MYIGTASFIQCMQRSQRGIDSQTKTMIIPQSSTESVGQATFSERGPEFPFRFVKGETSLLFYVWDPVEHIPIFWVHFEHSITFLRSFIHQIFNIRYYLPFIAYLVHAIRSLSALTHLLGLLHLLPGLTAVECTPPSQALSLTDHFCTKLTSTPATIPGGSDLILDITPSMLAFLFLDFLLPIILSSNPLILPLQWSQLDL